MAQQIKKKYIQDDAIDGEKLKLVKDQSVRGEDQSGQEVDLLKLDQDDKVLLKGEEAALKSQVDAEQQRAEGEESRIEGLVSAEEVRAMAEELRLAGLISAEEQARIAGDSNLDAKIETEKARIDAILSASEADKDSFAEIVALINSVDTENDSAFASYVTSNNARSTQIETSVSQEILDRTTADDQLQANIDSEEQSRIAADDAIKGDLSDAVYSTIEGLDDALAQEVSDRESGDDALQTTIDAIQGLDDILFEDSAVNSSQNATVDPEGRDGWYYKNAGSGEKALWYFFSSVDGEGNVVNPVTVEEFQGVYSVNSVEAGPEGDTFHMALYTTPQGDGNDASWYRSRRVYVPSEPFDREVKMLFYVGQEPDASVHPELPRMEMVESVVAGQQAGDFANSESMLYVAFSTNSVSQAGSVELLVNALGFNSSVYNKEYSLQIRDNFSLSGIKDSILSNQIQIEQNTAAIEALDGNFATDQELAAEATLRENADTELQANIDAETSARQSAVSAEQSRAEGQEAAIRSEFAAADSTLQDNIDQEVSARQSADTTLQSNIDTEKARIDAILNASEADKDSFAEIVSLINSVDTENDSAFASYVTSNDAALAQEVSDREDADQALQSQIDSLVQFGKESIEVTAQMITDEYVDLQVEIKPNSMVMFVDRLGMHEGLDYSVSTVNGVSRITFLSPMLEPSEEAIEAGQFIRVTYGK